MTRFNCFPTVQLRYLELLKLRFGESHLHFCEIMLKDVGDSRRINSHIHSSKNEVASEVRHNILYDLALLSLCNDLNAYCCYSSDCKTKDCSSNWKKLQSQPKVSGHPRKKLLHCSPTFQCCNYDAHCSFSFLSNLQNNIGCRGRKPLSNVSAWDCRFRHNKKMFFFCCTYFEMLVINSFFVCFKNNFKLFGEVSQVGVVIIFYTSHHSNHSNADSVLGLNVC